MERLYPENAWVTPCELFKPYYSYTVANFMLSQLEKKKFPQLKVLEIGPGTGTFADSCLDFFKNYDLQLYRGAEYVFCEISPQLAEKCEETMRERHPQLFHNNQIKIFNSSIMDLNQSLKGKTFVVGLEILDNMPHDRLYSPHSLGEGSDQETYTHVSQIRRTGTNPETFEEHFVPIAEVNDQLINLFLEIQG